MTLNQYHNLCDYTDKLAAKRSADDYVNYRKHFYSTLLLSGPPGTGKSEFIGYLADIHETKEKIEMIMRTEPGTEVH
jgi:DNA polymerase III delta prime subunit